MKVEEYVKIYYEIYRKPKHRENTQEIYESCIRLYITGSELGETNLSTVTTLTVQKHLTELLVRNLSRHTVNKIRQILISAFEQASSEGLMAKNFAKFTEPIPLIWRDNPIFTPEIQRRFLQKCRNRRFYVAYVLLFYLGRRRSEVLGLSWNNVDMKRNILYIRQTLIVIKGKPVLQRTTKTRRSLRIIPFPFEIKGLLQERRERQRTEKMKSKNWKNPDNLIFTSRDGSPYNPNYFCIKYKILLFSQSGSSNILPLGTILPYAGDLANIPKGWALCDGNNGTPNLKGRVLQSYDSTPTKGVFLEAGLPNIAGVCGNMEEENAIWRGAFYGIGTPQGAAYHDRGGVNAYFDASRCSPIYGRSSTVQPPAYTVYYIIKIK